MTISARGPGDGEYMSPALIEFVWSYMAEETLAVPPSLELVDAERALNYFGFDDVVVTVPDDDPACWGKRLSYKLHQEAMKKCPDIVGSIRKRLENQYSGNGKIHFVVDTGEGRALDPDVLTVLYDGDIHRIYWGSLYSAFKTAFSILDGDGVTATAARDRVAEGIREMGGLSVNWTKEYIAVLDLGEYGVKEYHRAHRHIMTVDLDNERLSAPEHEGIKRAKTAA